MPGQKRSRLRRKALARDDSRKGALVDRELALKLDKARADRDRVLGLLAVKYRKQLEELYAEWAAGRREIWEAHDKRRALIAKRHQPIQGPGEKAV